MTQNIKSVSQEVMHNIYEEVKTPYKYGIILQPEKGMAFDCPSVFRYNNKWHLFYISFDEKNYETNIAESNDLINWKPLGKILKRGNIGWDSVQNAGFIALQDVAWNGSNSIETFDNKYWMSYIGGANEGYETPPLSIGIAYSQNPALPEEWKRISQNPVLTSMQDDARFFEKEMLYKSNIIHDNTKTLGYNFIMFYNAKSTEKIWTEKMGIAVSNDMVNWKRYGDYIVSDNSFGISGDPQIVKIGDIWVMFYFGAHWKPKAFDRFACSYDLVNWTHWKGESLITPSEFYDEEYAHKPWVIKYEGIVYHFYCAVGKKGRVLALATSKYMGESELNN